VSNIGRRGYAEGIWELPKPMKVLTEATADLIRPTAVFQAINLKRPILGAARCRATWVSPMSSRVSHGSRIVYEIVTICPLKNTESSRNGEIESLHEASRGTCFGNRYGQLGG
jgi:hypothetical protein